MSHPRRPENAVRYRGEARGSPFEGWVEDVCRGLVKVDVTPLSPGIVDCSMVMTALPEVRLGLFDVTAIAFAALPTDDPWLYLQLPEETDLHLHHCGREMEIQGGGTGLADAGTTTARTVLPRGGRFRTIGIDRRALISACPGAEDLVVRSLDVSPGLLGLIRSYHASVMQYSAELDPTQQIAVSKHFIDLVSLGLASTGAFRDQAVSRGLAEARLSAIKTFILDNLEDAGLSPARVAAHFKITTRYLHMLFSRHDVTFGDFVIENRLERCSRALQDPRQAHLTISEVALGAGFNDLSYFNRTFRRRFGLTPSDVRESALGKS